jgi:TPR repeat protein
MQRVLMAMWLSMATTGFAMAGPFEDGTIAYDKGNYSEAEKLWRQAAEEGDAKAQWGMGYMYDYGKGVPQDHTVSAMWFRMAAEQGYETAQNRLGFAYDQGLGVPQNYVEAAKWYRKAAEQGHTSAQYNLGLAYEQGLGVPQDRVLAHMWLNLSAIDGGIAKKARDKLATSMTADEIAEAQRMAREWEPKQ